MEKIYKLALTFRNAIVKTPMIDMGTTLAFSDFPHACCDDASLLLAAFLTDNGICGSLRVHGVNGGNHDELKSHAWLSVAGLIVDITGDQFVMYKVKPVFVGSNSEFHDSFEIESTELADFRVKFKNDAGWLSTFHGDYKNILANTCS